MHESDFNDESEPDSYDFASIRPISQKRRYATFFEGGEKSTKELGILRIFEESLARYNSTFFVQPRNVASDKGSPDCEAEHILGGKVGFELTELVDERSVKRTCASNDFNTRLMTWKKWTEEELAEKIQSLISRKSHTLLKCEHELYRQLCILIHCDEPLITTSMAEHVLTNHSFYYSGPITNVFLMLSYKPDPQSDDGGNYPVFEVVLKETL